MSSQPATGTSHLETELVIVATGGQFERLLKEHFYASIPASPTPLPAYQS